MSDRRRIVGRIDLTFLLRERRLQLGLSQKSLAGQIGVPGSLLGEWERGEVSPTLASVNRWVKALDARLTIKPMEFHIQGGLSQDEVPPPDGLPGDALDRRIRAHLKQICVGHAHDTYDPHARLVGESPKLAPKQVEERLP